LEHVENEKGIIYELKINSDTKTLSEKGKKKKKKRKTQKGKITRYSL